MNRTTIIRNILNAHGIQTKGVKVYSDKRKGGRRVKWWGLKVSAFKARQIEIKLRAELVESVVSCRAKRALVGQLAEFSVRLKDRIVNEIYKSEYGSCEVLGWRKDGTAKVRFLQDSPVLLMDKGEVCDGYHLLGGRVKFTKVN